MPRRAAVHPGAGAACVELREPSDADVRLLDCDAHTTIAEVKQAMPALWTPHTLDPRGVRCIHRGQLLADSTTIGSLAREDTGHIVVHVAMHPDALTRAPQPAPQPPPKTPADAPPTPPPASASPLQALVAQLRPSELVPLAHALVVTHRCYARYYDLLTRGTERQAPRLLVPPDVDLAQADEACATPALRIAAVALVESETMHWTPLQTISEKETEVPQLLALLDARLAFLNEALFALARLADWNQWRTNAPRPSTPAHPTSDAHELLSDLQAILPELLWYLLRVALFLGLLTLRTWPESLPLVSLVLLVFAMRQGMQLMQQRRHGRAPAPAAPRAAPAAAHAADRAAATDPAAAHAEDPALLEEPRLPMRVPHMPWYQLGFWEHQIAYYGLADEERAMGFEHVATDDPTQRVHWMFSDYARPAPPRTSSVQGAALRPPPRVLRALHTYVLLPALVLLSTLHPHIQELRADAIALRRDAICAFAHKWEQLVASGKPLRRGPPALLEHPYARRILEAQRAQARTRAAS